MRKALHILFALLLTGAILFQSCGEQIEPTPIENQVRTYTLSVVAVKGSIETKALDLTQETLTATWKAGEKVTVYSKTQSTELEGYLEAQGDGTETILKGTLTGIIAANDELTLKSLDSDYSQQDGTIAFIAAHCDYATADVTVKNITNGNITTTDAASFTSHQAIVEFTLKDSDGSAISGGISSLSVVAGGTTVTVAPSMATNVLYVAIPAFSNGTVSLNAVDPNGAPRSSALTDVTLENGKYYRIDVEMGCTVMNDSELLAANASMVPKIVLGADITLRSHTSIKICGSQTIDLNGHSITGYKTGDVPYDRIFYVDEDKSLTLNGPGTLKEGHADDGGAIFNRGTLILRDITFTGCSAARGGAIYNEGMLCMSGAIVASDNTGDDNVSDNVYLASGTVITVNGAFTADTHIGITLADGTGSFTAGYSTHNSALDPTVVFSSDNTIYHLSLYNGEVELALWYDYQITAENTYASQQVLLDERGIDLSDSQFLLSFLFPDRDKPVRAISYTYLSVDPQGYPVKLSALLYIPDAAWAGTKDLTGICLANHGTIASNAECPTMNVQLEGAFAWKNYAIIMPDYYGFGVSADRPQAYLDPETTARGSIDAYLAAVQLLKDRHVNIPDRLYSFGYSQGGFNSMANLMYASKHPELRIRFEKVMCGGSPFDVELTWDAYTQGTFRNAIAFIPMTIVSINESQQLGLNYKDIFKGILLDNWQDWILSKQYDVATINTLIDTDDLSVIMAPEFMSRTGYAYNTIKDVCRRFSLTSGWIPPAGTQIILYHSKQDDTVPYANLTAMKAFLNNVAPGCYKANDGNDGGHVDAILSFIVSIIREW